ncbi:hypothetical protein BESB_069090 [Besnoitia besnoiti]|uniref:Transmembrane protein n=1 Tax=Besnoitia besnoiti TaxID=94643 RepID=A0A2A9MFX2_BESBE|nr:hypothetical protein BESB_069090 [Besnoitia besnoiti]PFH34876.1 hypothetical protein BESB_069090 [Besnoitia besnoiti]
MAEKGDEQYAGEQGTIFLPPAAKQAENGVDASVPATQPNVLTPDAADARENSDLLSERSEVEERIVSDPSATPDPFPGLKRVAYQHSGGFDGAPRADVDESESPLSPADEGSPRPGFLSCSISSDSLIYSTSSCPQRNGGGLQLGEDQRNETGGQQDSHADSRYSSTGVTPLCVSGSSTPRSSPLFHVPPEAQDSAGVPLGRPSAEPTSDALPGAEQLASSARLLQHTPSGRELQGASTACGQSLSGPSGIDVKERPARVSTWVPVGDLGQDKRTTDSFLFQNLEQHVWRIRLARELLAGLIGMQAVFSLTSFMFDNAAAGIVALFCMLGSMFAHADRRPASYLLTAFLALALASTVLVAICTRVHGFESYYEDDALQLVSVGQVAVLLLVSVIAAILTKLTMNLEKKQKKKAESCTAGPGQLVLPGALSSALLQRGASNAHYVFRTAGSTAAAATLETRPVISIPPLLPEEENEGGQRQEARTWVDATLSRERLWLVNSSSVLSA